MAAVAAAIRQSGAWRKVAQQAVGQPAGACAGESEAVSSSDRCGFGEVHRAWVEAQQELADERRRLDDARAQALRLQRSVSELTARAAAAEAGLAGAQSQAEEHAAAAAEEAKRREDAEAELRARCSATLHFQAQLRGLVTHLLDVSGLRPTEELLKGAAVGGPCIERFPEAGLALKFYPRGCLTAEDGQCSLFLSARQGCKVKFRLFVNELSFETEHEWEASETCHGTASFGPCQAVYSRVGVQLLRLRPPGGPELVFEEEERGALLASMEASQRAARQAEDDLEYALAALLRVQDLGESLLPRALRVPPGKFCREALLEALRVAGPLLLLGDGEEAEDPVEKKLRGIIGLEPVKAQLRQLRRTWRLNQRKRELGAPVAQSSPPHMVFSGSPGTGKTSMARLVAEVLRETGVVRGSAFVEAQRGDLVAGHVGQTASKTRAVIDRAKGGVLFVDEAYRLSTGGPGDYGHEVIEEIMKDLTTGDPVVCLAGYPKEMDEFLRVNPGLQRRFPLVFELPDASPEEIARIFFEKASGRGYRFGTGVSERAVAALLEQHTTPAWRGVRNGAVAELLMERTSLAIDARMPGNFTKEQAEVMELIDVTEAAEGLMKGCTF